MFQANGLEDVNGAVRLEMSTVVTLGQEMLCCCIYLFFN